MLWDVMGEREGGALRESGGQLRFGLKGMPRCEARLPVISPVHHLAGKWRSTCVCEGAATCVCEVGYGELGRRSQRVSKRQRRMEGVPASPRRRLITDAGALHHSRQARI
jgi:hypothetical protein